MAALVKHTELYVDVDYRLFAMIDDSNDRRNVPPPPHELDKWVSSTPGYVVVENIDDAVVLGSDTRLETWDGPADFDPTGWDRSDVLQVVFESGILGFSSGTAGGIADAYRLPPGRRWSVRLAWRAEAPPAPDELPTASVLIQFSPA
ncbi:hypothetical protein ACLQ29_11635 [Micromonospora sp. DT228]|uniref:hypothetical protein n=1 Tax=Micromonospora sp. DT228 TaxID=3393443 RepID=UPI003CF915C5